MRTVDKLRVAFGAIVTSTGACVGASAPRPSQNVFWPGPPSSSFAAPDPSGAGSAMILASAAPLPSEVNSAMILASNLELEARRQQLREQDEQAERMAVQAASAAAEEAEARRVKPILGILPVFKTQTCLSDWPTNALQGLALSAPVPSYLAWRSLDPEHRAHTDAEVGWRCRGARSEAACSARIEAAIPSAAGAASLTPRFFVVQRGETQEVLDTWPQLLALLGPIDTPQQAVLVVNLRGYRTECGVSTIERQGDAWRVTALSGGEPCRNGGIIQGHVLRVTRVGALIVESTLNYAETNECPTPGRRPQGWSCAPGVGASPLGAYFAQQAELEAASVVAFERIGRELEAFAAPRALIRRAARASRDETRHARMMRTLAERFGGRVREPVVPDVALRNLFDFALDNAVEGCARETYSALVAQFQACHSVDPLVARSLRIIAADERRHAALSWDLAQWVEARLSHFELVRLRERVACTYDELLTAQEPSLDAESRLLAGLPNAAQSRVLRAGFVNVARTWRTAA